MNSLNHIALESNPYLKINFDGGGLSSDAGLLLMKEFAVKVGLVKLIYSIFPQGFSLRSLASCKQFKIFG
ncbi:MAG: transposase [Lachnospiraceae bacterium]|nr:transposase [Lachnospiraceae bacterium]